MSAVRKTVFLLLVVMGLALVVSCGPSNNVRLMYDPSGTIVRPEPQSPQVAVVLFADARENTQILGQRKDNSVFTSTSSVTDWITSSLVDELQRKGMQVSYAKTLAQAQSSSAKYIVTGSLTNLRLQETGMLDVDAKMDVTMKLSDRNGLLATNSFTSRGSSKYIPVTSSIVEDLLSSTLRDLLTDMVVYLQGKM